MLVFGLPATGTACWCYVLTLLKLHDKRRVQGTRLEVADGCVGSLFIVNLYVMTSALFLAAAPVKLAMPANQYRSSKLSKHGDATAA